MEQVIRIGCAGAVVAGLLWPAVTPAQQPLVHPAGSTFAVGERGSAVGRWEMYGRSVEGRPLELIRIGQGPRQVLVVGEFSGRTSLGVELADRMAEHLARFPRRLDVSTVVVARDPNPDGRIRQTPGNANGVELDRNFFTADWRRLARDNRAIAGSQPESEPETKALTDLVGDVKPDAVVILSTGPRTALIFAGPEGEIVRQVSLSTSLRPTPPDAENHTGSLLSLAGIDRRVPTFHLVLAEGTGSEAHWEQLRRGLLAIVDPPSPAMPDPARQATPPAGVSGGPAMPGHGVPNYPSQLPPERPPMAPWMPTDTGPPAAAAAGGALARPASSTPGYNAIERPAANAPMLRFEEMSGDDALVPVVPNAAVPQTPAVGLSSERPRPPVSASAAPVAAPSPQAAARSTRLPQRPIPILPEVDN